MKILLVEDEQKLADALKRGLELQGYAVDIVSDGKKAFTRISLHRADYDIVILDLTVPGGMGGSEAMEELFAIDPGIKAIVSSGYANNPIMSEFRRYGFVDVISKPYKLEELSEAVSRALNKSS